jgi:hypothetical protein
MGSVTLSPDRDLELYRAEDLAHDQCEALMRAHLLDRLRHAGLDARVLRALASHPAETSHLARIVDAANFTQDPEADTNSRVQALVAALQAGHGLAGSLATQAANRASTAARKAAKATRNARILKHAAAVGEGVSEARKWQMVRNRMGKNPPSVATIRRVVKGQK